MEAVYVRQDRWDDANVPTEIRYPNIERKCKITGKKYRVIGVQFINESCNYDLLLLDIGTHGVHARKHAIRILAGKGKYFGGYANDRAVGMCYELEFVESTCIKENCDGTITYSKGLAIIEEYLKNC